MIYTIIPSLLGDSLGRHQLSPGDVVKFSKYSSKQHESLIHFNLTKKKKKNRKERRKERGIRKTYAPLVPEKTIKFGTKRN